LFLTWTGFQLLDCRLVISTVIVQLARQARLGDMALMGGYQG